MPGAKIIVIIIMFLNSLIGQQLILTEIFDKSIDLRAVLDRLSYLLLGMKPLAPVYNMGAL